MFWDELHHHQTIKPYGENICYSIFWGVYLLKVFDSHLNSFDFLSISHGQIRDPYLAAKSLVELVSLEEPVRDDS